MANPPGLQKSFPELLLYRSPRWSPPICRCVDVLFAAFIASISFIEDCAATATASFQGGSLHNSEERNHFHILKDQPTR
jgi:hypothetical protein